MDIEERVDHIQGEMTLIKGEIKQALIELRDMVTTPRSHVPEADNTSVVIHQIRHEGGDSAVQQNISRTPGEEMAPGMPDGTADENPEDSFTLPMDEILSVDDILGDEDMAEPDHGMEEPSEEPEELESSIADLEPFEDAAPPVDLDADEEPMAIIEPARRRPNAFGPPAANQETHVPYVSGRPAQEVRALDIHSVANILRWVGAVRPRIGELQLGLLLEIYQLTGHMPSSIEQLIRQSAKLNSLSGTTEDRGFTLDEYVDSLLRLHAIVSGLQYRLGGHWPDSAKPASGGNGAAHPGERAQELQPFSYDPNLPWTPMGSATEGNHLVQGDSGRLDANLVVNLVRWAGNVRARIGEGQLEDFLNVYQLTGNLPPTVGKLILKAAKLDAVAVEPVEQGFELEQIIDSLLKLHGIVHSGEDQRRSRAPDISRPPSLSKDIYG